MKPRILREIETERLIKDECKAKFPNLDPEWACNRWISGIIKAREESIIILAEMAMCIRDNMKEKI